MSSKTENQDFNELIIDDAVYKTLYTKKFQNREKYKKPNEKLLKAFIPGLILEIRVEEGQEVVTGDILLVLEAMKMRNEIEAPISGKIKKIHIQVNQKIPKAQLLLEFE